MEIILGTAASVVTTIITVLGAMLYLDRKIEANRRELSDAIRDLRTATQGDIKDLRTATEGDIKALRTATEGDIKDLRTATETDSRELRTSTEGVRKASEDAHKEINGKLGDIQIVQAAHTERFKCIESHLNVSRPDD